LLLPEGLREGPLHLRVGVQERTGRLHEAAPRLLVDLREDATITDYGLEEGERGRSFRLGRGLVHAPLLARSSPDAERPPSGGAELPRRRRERDEAIASLGEARERRAQRQLFVGRA